MQTHYPEKSRRSLWRWLSRMALAALAGCGQADLLQSAYLTGRLESLAIVEASGLACAGAKHWVVNDGGGGPMVYQIDGTGRDLGDYRIDGAGNTDWEDLAIVETEEGVDLLIADVGDNGGIRDDVSLYLARLPAEDGSTAPAYRHLRVRYPDGARDVEALAVDQESGTAYLLTKRSLPAELYSVPLDGGETRLVASFVGVITSLPRPSDGDLRLAPVLNDWYWQPTAMDFSADGRLALILTYRGVYLFSRRPGDGWLSTLNGNGRFFRLPPNTSAESACITSDAVLVTFEGRHAPVYRIPLDAPAWTSWPPLP